VTLAQREHIGPLDRIGNMDEAERLMARAWALVAKSFGRLQVTEYAAAEREHRRPRGQLHPWVPGLCWSRQNPIAGRTQPLPAEVMYVLRDILALERLGVLATHESEVVRRIRDEREAALWEIRVAGQYSAAGIPVEWSGLTDRSDGAPDVRIRSFGAEIEVKWLAPSDDIADNFYKLFDALDDAWSQIADRAIHTKTLGPRAIVVALPGANSLEHWKTAPLFVNTMSDRLGRPEYTIVSAIIFATEPFSEVRPDGQQFYGGRAWHLTNPNAVSPWPPELPLVSDD
jgi:hypothetical protein